MGKEKRKRDRTVSEADKGLKSQRLDGQAAAGKSLKSQGPQDVQAASSSDSSKSSAETTSSSHSDGNDGWCHHMYLDSEEVDMDVFHINNSKELPTCRCLGCGITRKGAGESKEGMIQCKECYYSSCAGWPAGRLNPRGHALLHAAHPKHHIAQWYDEQNLGYCFKCARSDTDNQDQSSNGGWPKVDRQVKDDRGMVASKITDQRGMVARKTTDQRGVVDSKFGVDWEMVASNSKVHWEIVGSNAMDQRGMKARDDASGYATGDGYVIRGMPNYGNTCYMNASLQCLLALGKLRTKILSPDARLGDIGMDMKQLFVETSSENNAARHMLDPRTMLVFMQSLYPKWFKDREMRDSHEFLSSLGKALDNEVTELNQSRMEQGEEVFCTFGHSIFKVPSEDPPPPARSVAECGNSQIPVLDLGVGAIEEAPKPLQVDSCEVKDVVRGCLQTQKNDVPGDTIEVPMEVLRFLSNLFDDSEDIKGKNKKDARAYNALHKVDTHDDMEELVEISSTDMEILGIGQDSLSIDIPGQIDEYIYKAFQQTSIVRIISSRRKRPIKEIHIVPPPRLQLSVLYASRPNGPREFTVRLSHLHLGMLVRQFCESEEGRRLKGRDILAVCLLMAKMHGVVSEEDFAAGCLPEAVRYRIKAYHELSEMEMRMIPSFLEEAEMIATSFRVTEQYLRMLPHDIYRYHPPAKPVDVHDVHCVVLISAGVELKDTAESEVPTWERYYEYLNSYNGWGVDGCGYIYADSLRRSYKIQVVDPEI